MELRDDSGEDEDEILVVVSDTRYNNNNNDDEEEERQYEPGYFWDTEWGSVYASASLSDVFVEGREEEEEEEEEEEKEEVGEYKRTRIFKPDFAQFLKVKTSKLSFFSFFHIYKSQFMHLLVCHLLNSTLSRVLQITT